MCVCVAILGQDRVAVGVTYPQQQGAKPAPTMASRRAALACFSVLGGISGFAHLGRITNLESFESMASTAPMASARFDTMGSAAPGAGPPERLSSAWQGGLEGESDGDVARTIQTARAAESGASKDETFMEVEDTVSKITGEYSPGHTGTTILQGPRPAPGRARGGGGSNLNFVHRGHTPAGVAARRNAGARGESHKVVCSS